MPGDLQKVVRKTRQDLMAALGETIPAREFGATIIMAMVGLHVTEARIRKTCNLEERRRLINEFQRQRSAIEKGIAALRRSSGRFSGDNEDRISGVLP